jgi:NDP-4-keto-2,6-dideoxyhexose 3-C-methyltransferase
VYKQLERCRLCGETEIAVLLELGEQYLTGIFPEKPDANLTRGPLSLVRCAACGLVQLAHSYNRNELYGPNYGYRSGLNQSMVEHLRHKAGALRKLVELRPGDIVVDIGSNDGTTLSFYPQEQVRVGFDPSAEKFRRYYPDGVHPIVDFFSAAHFVREFGARKAKVVTSIAMFYDLEAPMTASGISNRATCRPCSPPMRTTPSATSTSSTMDWRRSSA